jgi:hypothetical protein
MDDFNQKPHPSSPPAHLGAFESVHGDGSPGDPMSLDEVAAASRENHSDTEMEDLCMPEGNFRTDLRRKRKYTESRKKLLEDFEVSLKTIKKSPYIWLEDDLQFLRDFVAIINNDEEHFLPALPPGGQANELSLMTDTTPQIIQYQGIPNSNLGVVHSTVPCSLVVLYTHYSTPLIPLDGPSFYCTYVVIFMLTQILESPTMSREHYSTSNICSHMTPSPQCMQRSSSGREKL